MTRKPILLDKGFYIRLQNTHTLKYINLKYILVVHNSHTNMPNNLGEIYKLPIELSYD